MPNIRNKSTNGPCPCPTDGYQLGTDIVAIDIIDGNPAEYGDFVANIDNFGIDRDNSAESADLRAILGLPDPEVDSAGNIALRYKFGSGVKVAPTNHNYNIWRPYRMDCGCRVYDCSDGTDPTSSNVTEPIPCLVDRFVDDDGKLDINCDKLSIIPIMVLKEAIGVGSGLRFDGSIPNFMFLDSNIEGSIDTYDGIPVTGTFKNYVDPYGIVHSARWTVAGDVIDITFITKDPRIPGELEKGRVAKVGRGLRVFKTGIVTVTRQILRVVNGGYAILGQGISQGVSEFQATFGCGDEIGDPFVYHLDSNILEQVEMIIGSTIVQDPEDSTGEFEWWPTVLTGTSGGFKLFDGGQYGPVAPLHPPLE